MPDDDIFHELEDLRFPWWFAIVLVFVLAYLYLYSIYLKVFKNGKHSRID